jgi:hypothetical protein
MGRGSTVKAATNERFRFLGIEMDGEYSVIPRARIRHVQIPQSARQLPSLSQEFRDIYKEYWG